MGGHVARHTPGSYATSKAAVLRYTKGLADVLAPYNLNVNAICPGAVWTRFQEAGALSVEQLDPDLAQTEPEQIFRQRYEPMIPLGRAQMPEDIGKMAAFLLSSPKMPAKPATAITSMGKTTQQATAITAVTPGGLMTRMLTCARADGLIGTRHRPKQRHGVMKAGRHPPT